VIRKRLRASFNKRPKLKEKYTHRRLLIVDMSHTFHVGWHIHSHLTHRGKSTAGIYGFFVMLLSKINLTQATHVLVCKDRKPYLRSKAFPEYKSNRGDTSKEYLDLRKKQNSNMVVCEKMLDSMGVQTLALPGYEADDLITAFVQLYSKKFLEVFVLSGDTDLYQIFYLAENVSFLRRSVVYTRKDFDSEFDLQSLGDWLLVNAFTGGHNNLNKVPGVGVITAKKIIRDEDKLEKYLVEYKKLIDLNVKLMKLPYDGKKTLFKVKKSGKIGSVLNPMYSFHKFKLIRKYGVTLTQSMSEALRKLEVGQKVT